MGPITQWSRVGVGDWEVDFLVPLQTSKLNNPTTHYHHQPHPKRFWMALKHV